MSSQIETANHLMISIGEERNEAGEPLVCVLGVGVLGTLAGVKWLIAEYERHRGPAEDIDSKIATAIAAYDRDVLPARVAGYMRAAEARG